jgi:2-aminoadipate transaminase
MRRNGTTRYTTRPFSSEACQARSAGIHWTVPAGGFYVWVTVAPGIDTSDLLAKALQHRVAYVPGRGFYADGSGGDQMRLCFSYPPVERIHEGISRLGELLHTEVELVHAVYGDDVPEVERRAARGRGSQLGG